VQGDDLKSEESVIKAVTFDLWETLLFETIGSNNQRRIIRCRNLTEALNSLGLSVSAKQVELALDRTISSLVKLWDKNKDISHLGQIRLFIKYVSRGKLLLKDEWVNKISRAYVSPTFEVPPYVNPDACEIFEWLKSRGNPVGIICNTGMTPGTELRRLLSVMGVAEYFRAMIFSNEVGFRKPGRRIFTLAAQALSAEPKGIVHVGDNLKSDVWGAKNAGFRAIYLSGNVGRDRLAESDPKSLVTLSRNLGKLRLEEIQPDETIVSLSMVKQAIEKMEADLLRKSDGGL
jgi:putative hydrolase of the HAD superfamily